MTPIYDQIELIRILFPDIKELGIIYSSGEPNSELQVEGAKEAADQLGMNVTDVTISSTNEIQQVTESIIANVEAIYPRTMPCQLHANCGKVALDAMYRYSCR